MSNAADKILIRCPKCQKQYRVPAAMAGKQASCKCGTVFTAKPLEPVPSSTPAKTPGPPELADAAAEAPAPVRRSPTDCVFHPGTPAMFACADCRKLLCEKCRFPQHDGRHLCTECAVRSASPTVGGLQALSSVLTGTCQVHRDVEAVARCKYCNALVCATCDFRFPRDLHLCPRCATASPQGLGASRRALLIGSLAALGCALVAIAAKFFVGSFLPGDTSSALSIIVRQVPLLMILGPAVIGLGLAFGSFSRREGNPPLVLVSLALNTLMTVLWLVITIVQTFLGSRPPSA